MNDSDTKNADLQDCFKTPVLETDEGQIVKLPKEFRIESKELIMFFRDQDILLRAPVEDNIAFIFDLIEPFPEDFFDAIRGGQSQTGK
ncbi:MAG: AbrB/MazE/SpoVT family DNA-binding domain-containing protein [Deltaproteobacteria bacterium]|nr:AbrB/MazE/SpoVT family DNA-binding domain-containing protein [Deltaproteobacteria bacterium]